MSQNIKNLSKKEFQLLSFLSSQGKNIFTFEEAVEFLNIEKPYSWKFIHNLVRKGWLKQIEKGKYLIIPLEAGLEGYWSEEAFIIASNLVNPYAISYWTALSYYGYTEQITRTIFVATTKRKFRSEVEVLGIPYKFINLKKHKFFGINKVWINGRQVNITDREKTNIDCLDHPEHCGGIIEVVKGLSNAFEEGIDLEKITDYAMRMKNKTIFKRLGYLVEVLNLSVQEKYINKWRKSISKGYSLLFPTAGKKGKHNSHWNLIINIEENELISFRRY